MKIEYPSRALAKLREGTEILRTGGGIELTAKECNDLLNYIDDVETMFDNVMSTMSVDYDEMFPEED